jgi:hypothetical protein
MLDFFLYLRISNNLNIVDIHLIAFLYRGNLLFVRCLWIHYRNWKFIWYQTRNYILLSNQIILRYQFFQVVELFKLSAICSDLCISIYQIFIIIKQKISRWALIHFNTFRFLSKIEQILISVTAWHIFFFFFWQLVIRIYNYHSFKNNEYFFLNFRDISEPCMKIKVLILFCLISAVFFSF